MATVHESPEARSRVASVLTTDFCPWANKFVYWLKEPIGWFFLATCVSCMIGLYFSPIGWSLAAALVAMMCVGIAWPWIATRSAIVELTPGKKAVHEDSACGMIVSVRNRLPLPLWGLTVEGYLDRTVDDSETPPTVTLSSVPPWCQADYRVDVSPSLRGHYPTQVPNIACSFPFAIWTARYPMKEVSSLIVWPAVFRTVFASRFRDQLLSEEGEGSRAGRDGDFVGVRDYRRGDSAKHVHWVASARTDTLMVTERSGPETAFVEFFVDTECRECGVDELSRRLRVAASLIASLREHDVPLSVHVGDRTFRVIRRTDGTKEIFDALAAVPLEGQPCRAYRPRGNGSWIAVGGSESGSLVRAAGTSDSRRGGIAIDKWELAPTEDLEQAMKTFWQEIGNAPVAA